MQLTQKETSLISDLKTQEKLCIDKYTKSAAAASDVQLSELFGQIAAVEQNHYDTLCKMEQGTLPEQSGSSDSGSQIKTTFTATYGMNDDEQKKNDCFLCTDLLTTEKHASHLYDTCVFEFVDQKSRDALNTIQSQEQQHGKIIYDYMKTNSMY